MAGERQARVWAWVAAARDGDGAVSVAAVGRAAALWLGVDGASVTAVTDLIAREPLFASDALSARLEELQFTTGEGPAAGDFRLGSPVLIPDLEAMGARWPGFVSAAIAAGAGAMFALPLQAGAIRVGVLTLYRAKPGALAPEALADALVLADVALQLILDAAAGISGLPEHQLLAALSDRRAEVYQAVGMVAVQLGVSLEDAFVRLRAHAFATGRALADLADDVVTRVVRFSPEPSPEPGAGRSAEPRP
ncbi:MAG TPA: ANTAR domain-containing protein [Streptosporangiaceae bacterium]